MKTIRGQIVWGYNGEEDVVGILNESFHIKFFAELFQEALEYQNRKATVRYILSDKNIPETEIANELAYFQAVGRASADYGMAYSEITGYLWTTEKAHVGGHNLIQELSSNIGKFLHMEIIY